MSTAAEPAPPTAPAAAHPAPFRNRIVGYGDEAPDQLLANPRNWRIHPKHQQDAVAALLDTVGWVGEVTVNRATGFVVDGHLRVVLALRREEKTVPVKYVDLSPEEEALVLATLDPLSGMAATDTDLLRTLMGEVGERGADVASVLKSIQQSEGLLIAAPPSLTALAAAHGDPDDTLFWPVIRLAVPKVLYERFTAALKLGPRPPTGKRRRNRTARASTPRARSHEADDHAPSRNLRRPSRVRP